MSYRFIIAAVDESATGREVAAAALGLASRSGARLGLLTSIPSSAALSPARLAAASTALAELRDSLPASPGAQPTTVCCVVRGLPGIEVPRHAEEHGADLIVVGHTPRTQSARLLVGDTADAVTRRSRVPCLLVPPGQDLYGPVVVAVDGSRHSAAVLEAGCQFAAAIGQPVHAVTVESARYEEHYGGAIAVPLARSEILESIVAAAASRYQVALELEVRQGHLAEEILAACTAHDGHVLVIGFHRGGPAGVMEGASVGRRLVHASDSAVLTVPI